MTLQERKSKAVEIILKAGPIALEIAKRPKFDIEHKSNDMGPVTEADHAVSEFLMTELKQEFPDDLLISEESEIPRDLESRHAWLIDPIDGTKEFIKGNGQWSIMVGLVDANRDPLLGLVYEPEAERLYVAARGLGSQRLQKTGDSWTSVDLQVAPSLAFSEATLLQSLSHSSKAASEIAPRLGIEKVMHQGSLGLKLARIAEGQADLYFNFSQRTHLWDLCAGDIILREAGGFVCFSDQQPIKYDLHHLKITKTFLAASTSQLKEAACTEAHAFEE